MKRRHGAVIGLQTLLIPILILLTACGSSHTDGSVTLSSVDYGACLSEIQSGASPVYNYVRSNLQCATCHYQGSSAAPGEYYFADANFNIAMQGFANMATTNPAKFFDKVFDAGHFGGAGPSNQTALQPLRAAFVSSGESFNACMARQNGGGGGGGNGDNLNPTVQTVAKNIPANPTTAVNITWDLGSEMQTAGTALSGAQFRLTVRAVESSTGIQQYYVTAPNARGTTNSAIQIRNIRIFLNGALVALNNGGGTWTSLNNLAPASRLHALASGSGVMILQADTTLATNTLAVGFGTIQPSATYSNFNPTTYARLTSTQNNIPAGERVFQQKCVGCHGNSGGMSLAANNLGVLKNTGRVVPFSPEMSEIFQRISLQANDPLRMPRAPNAALSAEESRWIRDWILDGAP